MYIVHTVNYDLHVLEFEFSTSSLFLYHCLSNPPIAHSLQGWLSLVEDMMHKSLKDVLRACRLDLKKHLSKREKWVREWPGQVSIHPSFSSVLPQT